MHKRLCAAAVFALLCWPLVASCAEPENADSSLADIDSTFERLYDDWVASLTRVMGFSSIVDRQKCFDDNVEFQRIIALGTPAVPMIVKKLEENNWLGYALHRITKYAWHEKRLGGKPEEFVWTVEEFPAVRSPHRPPDSTLLWKRWWLEERRQTPERFAGLYEQWQALKREGKVGEAVEKQQRIKDLGIDALPLVVEKVKQGDAGLIAVMSYLTDGKLPESAKPEECVSWWAANKDKWTLPPPETAREPEK